MNILIGPLSRLSEKLPRECPMEPSELLIVIVEKLEELEIAYFVTGSTASIAYGEPRFTNDIDMVLALQLGDAVRLAQQLPDPDFYCSEQAMKSAIARNHQFNIIHPASGLKIDVMIPADTEFNRSRFQRRRKVDVFEGREIWFASPEDVILKKLEYYQEGGSEKHVRDILGVLKVQQGNIDFEYLQQWSLKLGIFDLWDKVRVQAD